jgi:hypothetical protein
MRSPRTLEVAILAEKRLDGIIEGQPDRRIGALTKRSRDDPVAHNGSERVRAMPSSSGLPFVQAGDALVAQDLHAAVHEPFVLALWCIV